MALSFSFPVGKVKKANTSTTSEASTECGESSSSSRKISYHQVVDCDNTSSKGPKAWKSFPSLAFFKESTTGHVKVSSPSSKLPVRTLAAAAFTPKTSHIPKPASASCNSNPNPNNKKIIQKPDLPLEKVTTNFTFGRNQGTTGKSLPDVTDTESPKPLSSYPPDKPCDLLAQIQSLNKSSGSLSSGSGGNEDDDDRLDNPKKMEGELLNRSFDDNGNPCGPQAIEPLVVVKAQDEQIQGKLKINDSSPKEILPERQGDLAMSNPNENIINTSQTFPKNNDESEGSVEAEIPRYFINAAELSEEDTFQLAGINSSPPCSSTNIFNPNPTSADGASAAMTQDKIDKTKGESLNNFANNTNAKSPPLKSVIRSRVPVSKSYPDIVQTTFNNDEKDIILSRNPRPIAKENSDLESLVADSLENLVSCVEPSSSAASKSKGENMNDTNNFSQTKEEESSPLTSASAAVEKPFKAFDSLPLSSSDISASGMGLSVIMGSSMMSESQMGGIFAEKPPEAWVIDLNSLSLDSELESCKKSYTSGSNSNSLAFFVNIDDNNEESSGERRNSGESSAGPEKKIFSMFVDIGEGESSPSQISSSSTKKQSVVNKPVMSIMETSTGSLKSMNRNRYPSPIFQHKAKAEAARLAARKEWEKQREKYFDSLEPTSLLMAMPTAGGSSLADDNKGAMGESTSSNRSSLHVANVLESSFSSSLISSMETSQQPGEMELCQGGPCFKLGKDLIRMFQEGINTDVNISVNGKWIKAHKCILASRSQYFAAILSGHWVEKAGNTINLDGFSYGVVQFTLYHIYSGTNEIPDTIDLLELATLTDLLGLEGLRENISQTFRVKFCHNFHRPCTGCITGVLECFPIALAYGMDELHRKMIKWICKHFVRIWPTKGFASLGDELIEKCLRYSINHLSVDNILDHTLGCDQLSTTMPTLRWTQVIFRIVSQLSEQCVQFLGENLCDVLQSQKFLQFGKGQAWNISRIEGTFVQALSLLKPDVACVSHTALSRLIELGTETIDEVEWSTSFVDFLRMLRDEVERYLLANGSKAVLSRCWEQLGQDVRKKICSSSFVGYDKFGNKIVKNSSGGSSAQTSKGTSSRDSRERPSSSSSSSRNTRVFNKQNSVPTAPVKPTTTHANVSSPTTRVASVRPMQSHPANNESNVQTPTATTRTLPPKKSTGRTISSLKSESISDAPPVAAPRTSVSNLRPNQRANTIDREKSFNSRRTSVSSPTSSANRTPMKPLTPSIPSKPSPLTGYDSESYGSSSLSSTRTTKSTTTRRAQKQPIPVEPPKKTFLSNSAKAAAVSKPLLKPVSKKTPSSSASSLISQGATPTPGSAPRSANISQSSRYLQSTPTSSSVGKTEGFSARSSFSNIQRPQAVKSKVESNPPRRNTYGTQPQGHTTIPTKIRRPVSSTVPSANNRSTNQQQQGQQKSEGHSSMPPVIPATTSDFHSLNESYSRESVMSRSTIETESGEVKMRTLAEIGRSSTFSKDEPTILGKMDGSGYGNVDFDYDEYE